MIWLKFSSWQDFLPLSLSRVFLRPAAFDEAAFGIVSLEMSRVYFDGFNFSRMAQFDDNPVMGVGIDPAFSTCLPAVTHVNGSARHDQIIFGSKKIVIARNNKASKSGYGQIDSLLSRGKFGDHFFPRGFYSSVNPEEPLLRQEKY